MPAPASPAQFAPSFRTETEFDAAQIERVLDRAFGPGRFAKPAERVREFARHNLALSRVAAAGPRVFGACRLYDIRIGAASGLFLGPLAVDPDARHGGIGHALASACIEAARAANAGWILLMGQPAFFSPLGFTQVPSGCVDMPTPVEARRLLWAELARGALDGLRGAVGGPAP